MAKAHIKTFSDDEEATLRTYVEANVGMFTYVEIAEEVCGGKFSAKAVQGKLLSMELTEAVKAAEKVEVAKKYTEAEDVTFIAMMKAGNFIEEIADKLNKSINSVRGKALSLTRSNPELSMPKQKESHALASNDPFADVGDVGELTIEAIIEAIGPDANGVMKTSRGIKTTLTRRGIDCADYKGATKAAKNAEKKDAA